MAEDPNKRPQDEKPGPPVMLIPKSVFYIVGALLIGSFLMTLFVRNPYTQASTEGSLYYERGMETNMALWVVIFIGVPASFLAYKHWFLPMMERRAKSQRR